MLYVYVHRAFAAGRAAPASQPVLPRLGFFPPDLGFLGEGGRPDLRVFLAKCAKIWALR